VSTGKVQSPVDLYKLTTPSLSEIERISENVADKLLALLWEKRELPLEVFLGALSIPLCASSTIRMVMDAGFDTWEKIHVCTVQHFETVPGLGPVKAQVLYGWLNTIGKTLVDDLLKAGIKIKGLKGGPLVGFSFCFTGKSERKRADLEALIVNNGGVVKTSVSKGLTYLVLADPTSASTKAKAAAKNGTSCISEEALIRMVTP
jgi:DNA ligase (NAD+)